MQLPAIDDKVIFRPNSDKHHIPNPEYGEFWRAFYEFLRKNFEISQPIFGDLKEKINPYFGNFGTRFQPVSKTPQYFHLGIDISSPSKTRVSPIASGILEYAGFGHINGNYVFLSHPEIVTEDGFTMCSLYIHLKNYKVRFGPHQKMLRKISFNKYPAIKITNDTHIGDVGSTGNASGTHSHLHLQIEFRNETGKIIVVNPASVLNIPTHENLTKDIKDEEDFKNFFEQNKKQIKDFKVENYWRV